MTKKVYIIRHGETAWSKTGQHTGLTDLELTHEGINEAQKLARRLEAMQFDTVFCSPLKRAQMTCEICGLLRRATLSRDLIEWNYGDFEGLTSQQIHQKNPKWNLFFDGAPGGESLEAIQRRVDHFWHTIASHEGTIALFTSGHIGRALAAGWLGMNVQSGGHLTLNTASISCLSFEHGIPVIELWNDTSHL